jgi:hypothetical protein
VLGTPNLLTAIESSSQGRLALYVPHTACIPNAIRQVLVPHDGNPSTSLAVDRTGDNNGRPVQHCGTMTNFPMVQNATKPLRRTGPSKTFLALTVRSTGPKEA